MQPAKLQQILREGMDFQRRGRMPEAMERYAWLRAAAPQNFNGWHHGGMAALTLGRADEAAKLLARALQLQPRSLPTALGLGVAQMALGNGAEAERIFDGLLVAHPKEAEVWHYMALALKTRGQFDRAIAHHRRAVALKPKYAPGWCALGATLSMVSCNVEALDCFARALTLDPNFSRARLGRAMTLFKCYRLREAQADFNAVVAREPRQWEAQSYRLMALNGSASHSREEIYREHAAFGKLMGETRARSFASSFEPDKRLRVAFLSPDLREHSIVYFLEPLLRHLPTEEFEVCLYHDHPKTDAVSERLRSLAAVWRDFAGQTEERVETAIRADAPDVLIDLAGHTGLNRLPLFARRLAPVQITYLGYPNTTGLTTMDYRFVDAHTDSEPEADDLATERLVRFAPTAWAYQPPVAAPEPGPLPCLEAGRVTFGSFNNFTKVTDEMLRTWSELLAAVPESRLLVKAGGLTEPAIAEHVRARLRAAGLSEDRVELLDRTPDTRSHLALYGRVDVALDTFPYHGTTTTCEALWMGVPVVTLAGDRHAARVGVSLLHAVGHPEWIAQTPSEYVRIAAELAKAPERLRLLRSGLRSEVASSPLGKHGDQAARFGAALRTCWRETCARLANAVPVAV